MERPKRLTATFVDKIDHPGRYSDGRGSHGLTLLVRPKQDGQMAKNWQQHLRVNGRLRSFGLGTFPQIKLVEAREKATEQAAKLREAFPLRPRKSSFEKLLAEASGQSISTYPLFSEVAEAALEYHATAWKGSKTADQRRGLLKTYLNPVLEDMEIDRVSSEHITEVLRPVWHDKIATSKKLWAILTSTFSYAIGEKYVIIDPLPQAKIGLGRQAATVEHHEALPYERVQECYRTFRDGESSSVTRLIEVIILTGVRKGEAREARWGEFNTADAVWTIPASRTKSAREHRIPLSAAVLDLLRRAREAAPDPFMPHELAFPNGSGRAMSPTSPLRFFQRRFKGYSLHGLRSTFRDWVAEQTDFSDELAEHALGHLVGDATIRAYRRTDYFEKRRELMAAWSDFVTA